MGIMWHSVGPRPSFSSRFFNSGFWWLPAGGGLLLLAAWMAAAPPRAETDRRAEKMNLVLRQTAHHLLRAAGDDTSRIAPVTQIQPGVWRIRMERGFLYDSLPGFLERALHAYQINTPYEVAVFDCHGDTLLLGYHLADLWSGGGVPCGGRAGAPDCACIQVTLPDAVPSRSSRWVWGGGLLAACAAFLLYRRARPSAVAPLEAAPRERTAAPESLFSFGQCSRLDVRRQVLHCGAAQHTLTYRETKLLHLFVQHPNVVLDRAFILRHVWADEGVLVSRSIDMFVSRLRKMLRADPDVQLTAVHGVGYKMQIAK